MREPLSRERVLGAAVALADKDGIDALTMRRLGAHLGGRRCITRSSDDNRTQ